MTNPTLPVGASSSAPGATTEDTASAPSDNLLGRALALLLVCATFASAQGLLGSYYDDPNLGALVETRIDPTIDFTDWGDKPTGTAVTPDATYSERWVGSVRVDATGDWTFRTNSNDGVRLWIDDQLIIDDWTQHAAKTEDATVSLTQGWHAIRLEHFQQNGGVVMQLSFAGPGQPMAIIPAENFSYDAPPTVSAGLDKVLLLPVEVAVLYGTASDDSGFTSDLTWSQVGGPPALLFDAGDGLAGVFDLFLPGFYTFRLSATDPTGLVGTSDVTLYVLGTGTQGTFVSGNAQLYQPLTLWFSGSEMSEGGSPNPFRDRRLDVTFKHDETGATQTVPGYFAADGLAADSGATSGEFWRAHFTPQLSGVWRWQASFRAGSDVALSTDPQAGNPTDFDGSYGAVFVVDSDADAPGFLAHGGPRNVGEHYLVTPGDGEPFFKIGANSPENLLAFGDFDQTTASHAYGPHVGDWKPGDPTWKGGKGKGLIGGLNYLASHGVNASYFLTFNVAGDGDDVWPWTSKNERFRFDVSKLDQWERVFTHMDELGIMLHVLLQETENDDGGPGLDGGDLGVERKLYLRELIARFAHHSAVTWNLGEENTNSFGDLSDHHDYIELLDGYDHPIVLHTYPGQKDLKYDPMLAAGLLDGASLQVSSPPNVHSEVLEWRTKSVEAGTRWVVSLDEQGSAGNGVVPDSNSNGQKLTRTEVLWPTMMAGGAGCEWYFGYSYPNDDLDCEDWRSRDLMFEQSSYALTFFDTLVDPLAMEPRDDLVNASDAHCLALDGEQYAIYLPTGGTTQIDLGASTSRFAVRWFDPRNGGAEQTGNKLEIQGPGAVGIGSGPAPTSQDWVVRLDRID